MRHDPQQHLEALLREEPYLRALARVLGAGNAEEILQQTWLHACESGGGNVERPRAWLARIMRNVTKNLARGDQRRRRREDVAAENRSAPSSVELMQREERRRQLVELVDALRADQREVVLLRYFEGLPPREIADRLGLPPERVWSLHRRAIERLRRVLDGSARSSGHSDRRAWLLPLIGASPTLPLTPTATPNPSNAVPLGVLTGTLAMTLKTKLAAAATVLAAIALLVWWPNDESPTTFPSTTIAAESPDAAQGTLDENGDASAAGARDVERDAVATRESATPATTGSLEVLIRHAGSERAPAAHATLHLRRSRSDVRLAHRFRADAEGLVRIDDLEPGRVTVWADRFDPGRGAEIVAGETATLELALPVGQLVRGRVVDPDDRPVAGARIDVLMPHLLGRDPESLAISNADGQFEIRGAPHPSMLGARAPGYRASALKFAYGKEGSTVDVTLRVTPGGGIVEGTVVDANGAPIEQAIVCVGSGRVQGVGQGNIEDQPPLPAFLRTDAKGHFRAVGVAPGENPVWVRAREMAPWRSSCVVAEFGTSVLTITMQSGGVVKGRVLTPASQPVAGAEVMHGYWGDIGHVYAHTDAGGNFELRGLPTGTVKLVAQHDEDGKCERAVELVGGRTRELDLVVSKGLELTGLVRDDDNQPVHEASIQVTARRTPTTEGWVKFTRTDAAGKFAIPNCPAERGLTVEITHEDFAPRSLDDVRPEQGTLDVRLQRADRSNQISGTVVDPNGKPLAGVAVSVRCRGRDRYYEPVTTTADGKFAFEELPTGRWTVTLRSDSYPEPRIEPRDIGPQEHWDLGKVRFVTGGRAIIRTSPAPAADLKFMIADTRSPARWAIHAQGEEPTTPILHPGEYRLMAWGKNAAAQAVTFTIVAGQRTEVPLTTPTGVHQRLEFSYDAESEVCYGATLAVYRGEEKLVDRWIPTKKGEPFGYDLWLLPGKYRVTLAGSLRGETELTVGDSTTSPVTVELR
ncbi:MAG: sigma-70 family RNA polymerase sigma factor [bacterium]|nr:sigma-70 family RNA polymerase sigma factor [bacterium]